MKSISWIRQGNPPFTGIFSFRCRQFLPTLFWICLIGSTGIAGAQTVSQERKSSPATAPTRAGRPHHPTRLRFDSVKSLERFIAEHKTGEDRHANAGETERDKDEKDQDADADKKPSPEPKRNVRKASPGHRPPDE